MKQKLIQMLVDKAAYYNQKAAALMTESEKISAETLAHQLLLLGVLVSQIKAAVCLGIAGVEAETAVIDEVKK